MAEEKQISFDELVKVRKEEMESMLPGFYAEVKRGERSKKVYSPNALEKTTLKVKGVDADA